MQFRDRILRCAATGKEFVWTVAEQRARARTGLPMDPPLYCPEVLQADSRLRAAYHGKPDDGGDADLDGSEQSDVIERNQPAAVESARHARAVDVERGPRPASTGADGDSNKAHDDDRRPDRAPGAERASARDRGPGKRSNAAGPRSGSRSGPRRGRDRGRSRTPGGSEQRQTELRVRHTGTVKWFDEDRGFGFIAHEDGGDVFLHATCLLVASTGEVREGTPVEYEVERTSRGPQAVDVVPLA